MPGTFLNDQYATSYIESPSDDVSLHNSSYRTNTGVSLRPLHLPYTIPIHYSVIHQMLLSGVTHSAFNQ